MSPVPRDLEAELSRARARVVASEGELRTIIEMNADGIVIVDGEGLIRFANPAAAKLFGEAPATLVGRPFGFPLIESDLTEIDVVRRGATPTVAEMRAVKIDWEGADAYLASMRDVTARRAAEEARRQQEEQLRQAQKMEAIAALAAEVAHDINNVLMGISGCSRVALQSLDPSALAHVFVQEIQRATEQGIALIHKLRTHSRAPAQGARPLDLNSVVTSMMALLQRLVGPGIELVADLHPALWRVTAEAARLEQVVMNLALNARDAMPRGGTIVIATRNEAAAEPSDPGAPVDEDYVVLSVTDDGDGMDEATKARAFEPLFTTKPRGKGAGLGLSTVRGIVEESGGRVQLDSERGRGTSVTIRLPGRATPPKSGQPAAPIEAAGSETVLLVDDEDLIRMSLRYELSTNGYRTLDASSGAAALDLCARYPRPIHALVTDLRMPGMSGRELARRAAELRPGIKIIFMTGYAGSALTREALMSLGHGLIEKPFTPDALMRCLREALGTEGPAALAKASVIEGPAALAKASVIEGPAEPTKISGATSSTALDPRSAAVSTSDAPAHSERAACGGASRDGRAERDGASRDERAERDARAPATILLVEDHAATRLALKRLLQGADRVVLDAENADDALALCVDRSSAIDVLITDISLGARDGISLAHAVRELHPRASVILMSGHARESLEPRFTLPSGAAFIEKPIDFDELDRVIDAAISRLREHT